MKTTLSLVTLSLVAASANAAIIGQLGILDSATGLNPGDQYRLIFITSGTTLATSTDITTYNDFAQAQAATAGLGSATWNAVGSTQDVDARDNTGTNPSSGAGLPVFLMNGTSLFAANNADLWDGANIAVQFDQTGAVPGGDGRVFTGSEGDGTEEEGADQFLGSTVVRTGGGQATGAQWMRVFSDNPEGPRAIYAMSEPLTAVPEPSSVMLLGLASLALFGRRRK